MVSDDSFAHKYCRTKSKEVDLTPITLQQQHHDIKYLTMVVASGVRTRHQPIYKLLLSGIISRSFRRSNRPMHVRKYHFHSLCLLLIRVFGLKTTHTLENIHGQIFPIWGIETKTSDTDGMGSTATPFSRQNVFVFLYLRNILNVNKHILREKSSLKC